jgi:NAD(P)-dependent dehydrogenase (short-subunit alcohol dehydrogenase family)
VNFFGALEMIRAFLPIIRLDGYGRIVNVSSGMGSLANMGGHSAAYKISKVALNALTRVAGAELRGTNIKVNAASPGWVRTDMGGAGASRSPEEGADTIIWLATLLEDGPTGGFFHDRESMDW